MNKRETGSRYEDAAAAFLQSKGLRLLEKNFRCRKGEIDLILMDGACLVFTEVKYRSGPGCGSPLEAIDGRKQKNNPPYGRLLYVYPPHFSGYTLPL